MDTLKIQIEEKDLEKLFKNNPDIKLEKNYLYYG